MMNIWKTWFDAVLGVPDPELQRLRAENEMLKAQMEAIRMKKDAMDSFKAWQDHFVNFNKEAIEAWMKKGDK